VRRAKRGAVAALMEDSPARSPDALETV
jgi:hypothetical protein